MKIIRWIFQPLLYHVAVWILANSHQHGTELSKTARCWTQGQIPGPKVDTFEFLSKQLSLWYCCFVQYYDKLVVRSNKPLMTLISLSHKLWDNQFHTEQQVLLFSPPSVWLSNSTFAGKLSLDIFVTPNHCLPLLWCPRLQRRSLFLGWVWSSSNPAIRILLPVQWRFTSNTLVLRWNIPCCYGSTTYHVFLSFPPSSLRPEKFALSLLSHQQLECSHSIYFDTLQFGQQSPAPIS